MNLVRQGLKNEAIQMLEDLLQKDQNFALAHNDVGCLYLELDNFDKALYHLLQAVKLNPTEISFKNNLLHLYIQLGQMDEALKISSEILTFKPDNIETLLIAGHISLNLNKTDDAISFYEKVLNLEPSNEKALKSLEYQAQHIKEYSLSKNEKVDKGITSLNQNVINIPSELGESVFPSDLIDVEIKGKGGNYRVKIPQNESFRIKEIIKDGQYAITNNRSHEGPLTAWDVGANVGIFAIYMKIIDPNSTVHCYEPSPKTLNLLSHNVGHIDGITIHPIALSNEEGEETICISKRNTGENSIKFKGANSGGTAKVKVKNANSEFNRLGLEHLDILKIDTEGCEIEILQSLGKLLNKIDYILLEYHSEKDRREIDNLLSNFYLFSSNIEEIGCGTNKYINSKLLEK